MLGSRGRWGGLAALACLLLGCGEDPDAGTLTVTKPTDDTTELRAHWPYGSFEVDVDLTLVTRVTADTCTSTGTLTVDEALSAATHYALAPTDCADLELTEGGDIVVKGEPTGHDWIAESLSVDTDKKVITLGPATGVDADGNPEAYRFTLSSPPCPDQPACSCGTLRRIAGTVNLDLPLGRHC